MATATTPTKPCAKCGTTYPVTFDHFSNNVKAPDGYHDTCRFCVKTLAAAYSTPDIPARICADCGQSKALAEFAKAAHTNDDTGRMKRCRACWTGKISRTRRAQGRTRRRAATAPATPRNQEAPMAQSRILGHKTCSACKVTKPYAYFARGPCRDGLQSCCRPCHKANTAKGRAAIASRDGGPAPATAKRRTKRRALVGRRLFTKQRARPAGSPDAKKCGACGRTKTWKSFYTDRKHDDNLNTRCIDCQRKGRKVTRRQAPRTPRPYRRTLASGKVIQVGGVIPATRTQPAQAVVVAGDLGVAATTLDALFADREVAIRVDERRKVLAEIDARYILVVKPK